MSRKYLTLVEPSVLDSWLKNHCELYKKDRKAFIKHTNDVFAKYDELLNVVAHNCQNEQQFIGASGMVIAILECIEDSTRKGKAS